MDRLWHVLKLLKHGKIKLVCESLDEPCVICPFVGRNIRHFRLSFPGVDRGPCWKPSSRQSSELGALSATHGQRHPSALYKNVKYPKVLFQIFRTQKSTSIFFFLIFVFFSDNFSMSSDIRHQMCSWHRTLLAPRAEVLPGSALLALSLEVSSQLLGSEMVQLQEL